MSSQIRAVAERFLRIPAGDEALAAYLLTPSGPKAGQALFLHGAGHATKDRAHPLAQALALRGILSCGIDFSGHGESTGELRESSLRKRLEEAEAALALMESSLPLTVVGFSMGGHIALELATRHPVRHLILFYPAVYTHGAFTLPFDERFTAAIRQPDSWRHADILSRLATYNGSLLTLIGDRDTVIPSGVVEAIETAAVRAYPKETLVVNGAGHDLLTFMRADQGRWDSLVDRIGSRILR